jgi:hypothetical protein
MLHSTTSRTAMDLFLPKADAGPRSRRQKVSDRELGARGNGSATAMEAAVLTSTFAFAQELEAAAWLRLEAVARR